MIMVPFTTAQSRRRERVKRFVEFTGRLQQAVAIFEREALDARDREAILRNGWGPSPIRAIGHTAALLRVDFS